MRAIEAVARHGHVTRAAAELGVTQSAVSRQILEFEAARGLRLFRRERGRLVPTPAGRHVADEIARAFHIIQAAMATAGARPSSGLTLSMLPSVATKWLAPRLDRFFEMHPAIELSITASRALVDFEREPIDAAIRYGLGDWPGVSARLLARETILAVMSPPFARDHGITSPADLARVPILIGDLPEGWRDYARAGGVAALATRTGPRFGEDGALLEAAAQGLGVALGRSHLVARDLAEGRLIAPFDITLPSRFSYWFVWPARSEAHPARAFVLEWLLAEFAGGR